MSDVPYIQNKDPRYSGAAAVAMAAKYHGIEFSHDKTMQTGNAGYSRASIISDLQKLGLIPEELFQQSQDGGTDPSMNIDKLLGHIDRGNQVIVNVDRDGEDHYLLAYSHDAEHIEYHDPVYGAGQKMKKSEFDKIWQSSDGKYKKWCTVVKKDGISEGQPQQKEQKEKVN